MKKKKMNPKIRRALDYIFGMGHNWKDMRSMGGRLCLNIGWYQGHAFRIFSAKFGEILWDKEIGYFSFFDIMITHASISLVFYPFDEPTGDGD